MSLTEVEFAALRQTIATRGTVRIALLPFTLLGWALLVTTLLLHGDQPIGALFSLTVLAGGFEAIHALHVGVERIGRYLQVYCESAGDGPQWETTAMTAAPALPGGGVDPLFTVVFAGATVLNLIPALVPGPTPLELLAAAALHGAFIVRIVRARGAAGRQRAIDLDRYRMIRSQQSGR